MTKIMLLGDTHGNINFIEDEVIPAAKTENVKWIYQLGDFGYWEHTLDGEIFLNRVQESLALAGLQFVFIAGNHDKTSKIFLDYPMVDGFFPVRPNIWFAPNGTQWEFEGTSFLALGGAYSLDKASRLEQEEFNAQANAKHSLLLADYSKQYVLNKYRKEAAETLWFPEEEMTDLDMERILTDLRDTRVDVILAHDKPLLSNTPTRLLDIAETVPNQRRLQNAVNTLQPKLFVHGHLHMRYTDSIRCGDDNSYTRVEGLGADVPNFNQSISSWEPSDAWKFLNL